MHNYVSRFKCVTTRFRGWYSEENNANLCSMKSRPLSLHTATLSGSVYTVMKTILWPRNEESSLELLHPLLELKPFPSSVGSPLQMARDFLRTCVVNNNHVKMSPSNKVFGLITVDQLGLDLKVTMDGDLGESNAVISPSTWVFFLCPVYRYENTFTFQQRASVAAKRNYRSLLLQYIGWWNVRVEELLV